MALNFLPGIVENLMEKLKDENGHIFWRCEECKYTAKSASNVYKHFERAHLNLSYICPFCSATFRSKTNLATHYKKHS